MFQTQGNLSLSSFDTPTSVLFSIKYKVSMGCCFLFLVFFLFFFLKKAPNCVSNYILQRLSLQNGAVLLWDSCCNYLSHSKSHIYILILSNRVFLDNTLFNKG